MVFDPPRRRRAWRWLVPLILLAASVAALLASGAGGDAREEIAYLNEMSEQIEEIALGGDALREVIPRLNSIDRPEWLAVIDDLRANITAGLQFAEQEPPAEELFAVRSLYRLALQDWSDGVGGLGTGVLAAADNPNQTAPVDSVANAIVLLRAGDSLFDDLLDEIDRLEVRDPIVPFRDVTLAPAEGEAVTLAVSYALAARSPDNGLSLRPGLAASQLVADPEWQLDPEDQVVMPATDEVAFSVVISNLGNLTSAEEQLVLTFTDAEGSIELTATIPPLQPGAQTTVAFEPLPISPGETYEVAAEILVSDIDSNFEDNRIQVLFRVNPE